MHRTVDTKQIIGNIIIELINQNKSKIVVNDIFKIGNKVDKKLNDEKMNASLLMTINDVYQVVYSYGNIITLEKCNIIIHKDYTSSKDSEIIFMIEDYFISGMPSDVNRVILDCVKEWYKIER